jgi:hypothetical protein
MSPTIRTLTPKRPHAHLQETFLQQGIDGYRTFKLAIKGVEPERGIELSLADAKLTLKGKALGSQATINLPYLAYSKEMLAVGLQAYLTKDSIEYQETPVIVELLEQTFTPYPKKPRKGFVRWLRGLWSR